MKTKSKIIIAVIIILAVIQLPFFTPEKNMTDAKPKHDIGMLDYVDPMANMDIVMHLIDGCYDCHSNYTENYPWYYHIQPISWWMAMHIKNAKKDLNFSEFTEYTPTQQAKKFEEIEEVMNDHSMPLKPYLLFHKKARLTNQDYQKIAAWAKQMQVTALAQSPTQP